jgi:hypothetical protein
LENPQKLNPPPEHLKPKQKKEDLVVFKLIRDVSMAEKTNSFAKY